jgi:hypothetical protein
MKRIGARTSLIVDAPNARIPLTPMAEKIQPPSVNFVSPCCKRPIRVVFWLRKSPLR